MSDSESEVAATANVSNTAPGIMESITPEKEELPESESEESDDEVDDEEYTVEKILDKRTSGGVIHYLLKWKNYSDEYNSWEPKSNIYCDELIQEFEEELKKIKKQNRLLFGQRSVGRKRKFSNKKNTSSTSNVKNSTEHSSAPKRKFFNTTSTSSTSNARKGIEKRKIGAPPKVESVSTVNNVVEESDEPEVNVEEIEDDATTELANVASGSVPISSASKIIKVPKEIIGMTNASGELMFLFKWHGIHEVDLVSREQANLLFPQFVIQYYEQNLRWT